MDWMSAVTQMANWYQTNIHEYNQSGFYECPLLGGAKVRSDCSGFVSACLNLFNPEIFPVGWRSGSSGYSGDPDTQSRLQQAGFTQMPFSEDALQPGDIYSAPSCHVEISAGNRKTYSWGACHDTAHGGMPSAAAFGKPYNVIFRCGAAGSGTSIGAAGSFIQCTYDVPRIEQPAHELMVLLGETKKQLIYEILDSYGIIGHDKKTRLELTRKNDFSNFARVNSDFVIKNNFKFDDIKITEDNNWLMKYKNEQDYDANGMTIIETGVYLCNKYGLFGSYGCGLSGNFSIVLDADIMEWFNQTNGDYSSSMDENCKLLYAAMKKFGIPDLGAVAWLGQMVSECGLKPHTVNMTEYKGSGASGTSGWNCGEGLIGITHHDTKVRCINEFNSDKRHSKTLNLGPYFSSGTPIKTTEHGGGHKSSDGNHICDLNHEDAVLISILYTDKKDLNMLMTGQDLAEVAAYIFLSKAGPGGSALKETDIKRKAWARGNDYARCNHKGDLTRNPYLRGLKDALTIAGVLGVPMGGGSVTGFSGLVTNPKMKLVLSDVGHLNSHDLGQNYTLPSNVYKGKCTSGPQTWYGRAGIRTLWWKGSLPHYALSGTQPGLGCGFVPVWQGSRAELDRWTSAQLRPGDLATLYTHTAGHQHAVMWTGKDWRSDCIQSHCDCYSSYQDWNGAAVLWRHPQCQEPGLGVTPISLHD